MPIPSSREPLSKKLLRDDAYDRITSAIVRGELSPGEKLNDQEIAQWLGISRTPVREALARLERTGLVRTIPGRVTEVSQLDHSVTDNAAKVAAALHVLAVQEATTKASVDDIAAMRAANARFADALDRADVAGAITADDAFHDIALKLADNGVLNAALEQVMPLLRRAEHLRFNSFISRDSPLQHEAICAAMEQHDVEEAERAARVNWLTLRTGDSDSRE